MKLGEWIKQYRDLHGLSMQAMADLSGFSKAYIGMLEKGINPTTKKPLSPTIQTFQQIARATGMDLDGLIKALDTDQPITINAETEDFFSFTVSPVEREHIKKYRALTEEQREAVDGLINHFFDRNKASSVTRSSGMIEVTIPVVEDERAKLHRLLDEELDKEKEGRRASSYGNSATGTK